MITYIAAPGNPLNSAADHHPNPYGPPGARTLYNFRKRIVNGERRRGAFMPMIDVIAAYAAAAPVHVERRAVEHAIPPPAKVLLLAGTQTNRCPFSAKRLEDGIGDDGCLEAPPGPPQRPGLLLKYGRNRPPWNVAGVDYHAGMPAGYTLTDWQDLNLPGIDVVGKMIRCDGNSAKTPFGGTVVLDGIDFTAHGGALSVYVPAGGCPGIVIQNSKFGAAGTAPGCSGSSHYQIQNQNPAASVLVARNTFDMTDCKFGQASIVRSAGPVTLKFNYFGHFQAHILEAPEGPFQIDYRYNFIEDGAYLPLSHMNFQEFSGAVSTSSDLVAFNTVYEYQPNAAGGEAFQFYGNRGGKLGGATLANNTIIALDTGSCRSRLKGCLISYAIHGHGGAREATILTGSARNINNYFDTRGMFGAYYGRSMAGWMSSGNIDMTTGAHITPK